MQPLISTLLLDSSRVARSLVTDSLPLSLSSTLHKTRRGFATILAETARAHLLLSDGASLDVLASARN